MAGLPEPAKTWLDDRTFVVLGTVNADGSPHSTVHWVARDGDDLLLSTVRGRLQARNVERDPRVSVLAVDPGNPYAYLEVRATAQVTEDGARALIDDLMEKYRGQRPYPWDGPDAVRLLIRVPPERVVSRGL